MGLRKFIATTIREYLNEQYSQTNNIWYHGSKEKFDKFKLKQGTLFDADYTAPIFLTSNILNLIFALLITSFDSASIFTTLNLAVIGALEITFLTTFPTSFTSTLKSLIFSLYSDDFRHYCSN